MPQRPKPPSISVMPSVRPCRAAWASATTLFIIGWEWFAGGKVEFPAGNTGLKLGCAITAVAEPLQNTIEICQEKNIHAGISRDLLPQAKVPCLTPKITFLKQLKCQFVPAKHIGAGRQIVHCVDNEVEVVERRGPPWAKEIRRNPTRRSVKHRGELRKADRVVGELAG